MEIRGVVDRMFRDMEFLLLLLLGLTISAYAGKLQEYIMPSETCTYIVDVGDQFKVSSQIVKPLNISASDDGVASYTPSYPANVSCEITFRTEPHKKFFMRITKFQVQDSTRCEKDALRLYNAESAQESKLIKTHGGFGLCGLTLSLPNYFYSSTNAVTIKFKTDATDNAYAGFSILLSPFWRPEPGDSCLEDEFQCHLTKKCLSEDVRCNGEYQCEDGSDEPANCQFSHAPSHSPSPSPYTNTTYTLPNPSHDPHHLAVDGNGASINGSWRYSVVTALALLVILALASDGSWLHM